MKTPVILSEAQKIKKAQKAGKSPFTPRPFGRWHERAFPRFPLSVDVAGIGLRVISGRGVVNVRVRPSGLWIISGPVRAVGLSQPDGVGGGVKLIVQSSVIAVSAAVSAVAISAGVGSGGFLLLLDSLFFLFCFAKFIPYPSANLDTNPTEKAQAKRDGKYTY